MGFDLGGIARSRLMQIMFGSQRHTSNPPTSNQYELFYLLNHIHNHQFKQEKNSEPPAPAPAAAPPAEVPKAAAAVDAAATKKSSSLKKKIAARTGNKNHLLKEQFSAGRLYACISYRSGQCGRYDRYILEDKELEFYSKKFNAKKK